MWHTPYTRDMQALPHQNCSICVPPSQPCPRTTVYHALHALPRAEASVLAEGDHCAACAHHCANVGAGLPTDSSLVSLGSLHAMQRTITDEGEVKTSWPLTDTSNSSLLRLAARDMLREAGEIFHTLFQHPAKEQEPRYEMFIAAIQVLPRCSAQPACL